MATEYNVCVNSTHLFPMEAKDYFSDVLAFAQNSNKRSEFPSQFSSFGLPILRPIELKRTSTFLSDVCKNIIATGNLITRKFVVRGRTTLFNRRVFI